MERTVFALPLALHQRLKYQAERKGTSIASLIREALAQSMSGPTTSMLREARAQYSVVADRMEEESPMKRIVISLPEDMLDQWRVTARGRGVSMGAYIRDVLEERTRVQRPKPRFGAFASGYPDTSEKAGEMQYEPRSWH